MMFKLILLIYLAKSHWWYKSEVHGSQDAKSAEISNWHSIDSSIGGFIAVQLIISASVGFSKDWNEYLKIQLALILKRISEQGRLIILDNNGLSKTLLSH